MNTVLIKPVISEKSMREAAKNRYTFRVDKDANKAMIFKAIADTFNVKPISIKTLNMKGKSHRSNKTREMINESLWKKAVVELAVGQKIDIFDVTEGSHKHHA